jgi:hypothetical protein
MAISGLDLPQQPGDFGQKAFVGGEPGHGAEGGGAEPAGGLVFVEMQTR